jgi:hypothetical protein
MIDKIISLNFTSSDNIKGYDLIKDTKTFHNYLDLFLHCNQTFELVYNVPVGFKDQILFPRSSTRKVDETNLYRQVDFVPNVFKGRTESVCSVLWYNDFKLSEHEDFFLRFGHANQTVYTCEYIHVQHYQIPW